MSAGIPRDALFPTPCNRRVKGFCALENTITNLDGPGDRRHDRGQERVLAAQVKSKGVTPMRSAQSERWHG